MLAKGFLFNNMNNEDIKDIIELIKASELDETIKAILIRDLESEGLTEFLREQIKSYCLEGIKRANAQIERAKNLLGSGQNPPL
jgi:hypothetical protein